MFTYDLSIFPTSTGFMKDNKWEAERLPFVQCVTTLWVWLCGSVH